jgi:spore germination protein
MKNKIKKNIFWIILIISIAIIIILAYLLFKKNKEVQLVNTNLYNSNFYELVDYIQNVETYLSKSTISTSSTHSAETLTYLWREANLAQTYLSELPIQSQELENTSKFLNQVSDYSYALSRKNIKGEDLTEEELKNLEELHSYSLELENTLNELALELENGALSWKDLTKKDNGQFAQSVSSSLDIFDQLEQNFHEYSGLIYDGAFSEHLTSSNPKMIKGDEISEEDAAKKAKDFLGENNAYEISNLGANENANILAYNFSIKNNDGKTTYISISKKGGYVIYSSFNREIKEQKLNYEEANNKALEYLKQKGFDNMKETYYLAENGILTINYAYVQQDIIMYPDLIKIKVALDNGEILGIETTGYLSNHEERNLKTAKITKEEAKKKLNKNLNIMSEKMAVIPTEYKTEIFCYEFKGKIDDREFIVYINAETGEEEDILVIYNTPNGVLTM